MKADTLLLATSTQLIELVDSNCTVIAGDNLGGPCSYLPNVFSFTSITDILHVNSSNSSVWSMFGSEFSILVMDPGNKCMLLVDLAQPRQDSYVCPGSLYGGVGVTVTGSYPQDFPMTGTNAFTHIDLLTYPDHLKLVIAAISKSSLVVFSLYETEYSVIKYRDLSTPYKYITHTDDPLQSFFVSRTAAQCKTARVGDGYVYQPVTYTCLSAPTSAPVFFMRRTIVVDNGHLTEIVWSRNTEYNSAKLEVAILNLPSAEDLSSISSIHVTNIGIWLYFDEFSKFIFIEPTNSLAEKHALSGHVRFFKLGIGLCEGILLESSIQQTEDKCAYKCLKNRFCYSFTYTTSHSLSCDLHGKTITLNSYHLDSYCYISAYSL